MDFIGNKNKEDYVTVKDVLKAVWGLPMDGKIRFRDSETREFRKGILVHVKDVNELGCLFG